MAKTIKELLAEKLSNFKHLICVHVVNEENENFEKLMNFDVDKIIAFYIENVRPYLSFGHQTIIRSFLSHLEIAKEDEELIAKLEQYFKFFEDAISQLEKHENDEIIIPK